MEIAEQQRQQMTKRKEKYFFISGLFQPLQK
jgi:hypothetical protein